MRASECTRNIFVYHGTEPSDGREGDEGDEGDEGSKSGEGGEFCEAGEGMLRQAKCEFEAEGQSSLFYTAPMLHVPCAEYDNRLE